MMQFFLDASALAKRYVGEPGTPVIDHLLDSLFLSYLCGSRRFVAAAPTVY
jgi:predicted nucleic acid-binding protein